MERIPLLAFINMHTKTLAPQTKAVLDTIKTVPEIQTFYLSGGTALALHLGHRESEDLDFFTKRNFEPLILQEKLAKLSPLEDVTVAGRPLNAFFK